MTLSPVVRRAVALVAIAGAALTGPSSSAAVTLVPTGMDPGMTRRLAATPYPLSPSYAEFCPDSSTGQCRGTVPSGGRFYTLATGSSAVAAPMAEDKTQCRIGSDTPYLDSSGAIVPCPYDFAWRTTAAGKPVAAVLADSTKYSTIQAAYNYFGLQENVGTGLGHVAPGRPASEVYAGLPAPETDTYRPEITKIEQLDLDIRASKCLGSHTKDTNYGRVFAYVFWYDSKTNLSSELSIDLSVFHQQTQDVDIPLDEYFFEEQAWYYKRGGPAPVANRWVGHIDGRKWGLLPKGFDLQLDNSADCSGSLKGKPTHIKIDFAKVLQRLVKEGLLDPKRLKGRYVGAIVNGVETWGRTKVESEVSGFTLRRRA